MVYCAIPRRSYVGSRPIHLQILHHDQLAPYSVIVKQYYAINEQKLCPFFILQQDIYLRAFYCNLIHYTRRTYQNVNARLLPSSPPLPPLIATDVHAYH